VLELTIRGFGTQMITVRVGKDNQTQDFAIYETLIRKSSTFVDNALKGSWRESTDRVVTLPEFDCMYFGIYHQWLLTGKLHSKMDPKVLDESYRRYKEMNSDAIFNPEEYALLNELVYLEMLSHLGHYLLDTNFMDTVSDAMIQIAKEFRSHGCIFSRPTASFIYDVIPEGSPTRSLVADLVAWTATWQQIRLLRVDRTGEKVESHPDFISDVLQALALKHISPQTSISPLLMDETSCKYHSHGDEKPCYRKKKAEKYVTAAI